MRLTGLAIPYNVRSERGAGRRGYRELILPGAFHACIRSARQGYTNIFALRNHDRRSPLACTADGDLELWEEADGVHFAIRNLPLPRRFSGVSFNLNPIRWEVIGKTFRVIEASTWEISLLTQPYSPAYRITSLYTWEEYTHETANRTHRIIGTPREGLGG